MSKLLEQIPRGVWIEFADDGKKVVDIIHEPKDAIMPDRYVWCQECKSGRSEADYLRDLLRRLMAEVRPYARPSLVQYDVFPVFKEAVDYVG